MPRSWLIAAVVTLLAPWLIVGTLSSWNLPDGNAPDPVRSAGEISSSRGGADRPWGELITTPIVISPPLEYVPTSWGPIEPPEWRLPGVSLSEFEAFLVAVGVAPAAVRQIVSSAQPAPAIGGLVARPDPAIVRSLSPDVRARLYLQLAGTPLNDRQRNAYRYAAPSVDAWLGRSIVSPETISLVEPLIYRQGGFQYFADIDLIRGEITDPDELQRLAKMLFRQATLLLTIRVHDVSQVDRIAEYWGRGGRRTDIRPLLESIAASEDGERMIDVSHLLPTFARNHLYRFPKITLADLERPSLVNCFWTALNFFNAEPDDRFLDDRVAVEHLKRNYYIVHDGFQFGDIVAFADAEGTYFHAAVYLADGLIFGKNGTSTLSPWTILPIEQLEGYYVEHADDWQVVYYRRNDF